jgi:hypothetical protein
MTRRGELMSVALKKNYAASDVGVASEHLSQHKVVETIPEIGRSKSQKGGKSAIWRQEAIEAECGTMP